MKSMDWKDANQMPIAYQADVNQLESLLRDENVDLDLNILEFNDLGEITIKQFDGMDLTI